MALENELGKNYSELTLEIMDLVGNKWTLLLVYQLSEGSKRFSELKRSMAPITQKMLTQKLKELARYGMIDRLVWPSSPPKVEYSLTPLGLSFLEAAKVICEWTRQNITELEAARHNFEAEEKI